MLLQNKKALVSGGSRGIGRAIVEKFLSEGAEVACLATQPGPYQGELQQLATSKSTRVFFYHADVGSSAQITELIPRILGDMGHLDVLVNNAGITRDGLLFAMKDEQWDEVIRVNLSAAFYFCRVIGRHMATRKSGSIINVSSVVGLLGNGGQANYAAAKSGLIGFSKSVARELASRSVRVNTIAPGFTQTDMTSKLSDKKRQQILAGIPLSRMGQAQEIADAALFLASEMASYITGQTLAVDGGMTMV